MRKIITKIGAWLTKAGIWLVDAFYTLASSPIWLPITIYKYGRAMARIVTKKMIDPSD